MKKWLIRLFFLITIFIVGIWIYLFFALQPPKYNAIYSPNSEYLIYQRYGNEHQALPYASIIYLEKETIFPIFNTKHPVMMGYCKFEYSWLSELAVNIICIADDDNEVIKIDNDLGIQVLYETRRPID